MVEIVVPKTEPESHQKKERNQKRGGLTKVTSVSVSEEFKDIVERYELSPTEVFRRGVAVTLADMDIPPYNTPMNNKRLEAVRSKLELDKIEELVKQLENTTKSINEILEETKELG